MARASIAVKKVTATDLRDKLKTYLKEATANRVVLVENRRQPPKYLAIDPEGYGLPLRGSLAGYWKHQFGNHRVVYRIYSQHHVVVVCSVGVRKQGDAEDIYRQLESVAKTGRLAEQLASVLRNLLPKKK